MIKLIIAFIIGCMVGGTLGVVMMCCFIVAGDEDRRLEKLDKDNNITDSE